MPRALVLSNGELHVGLSRCAEVGDFYFPYVGLENHTIGEQTRHRIGVWVNGEFSWLSDDGWSFSFDYHRGALIGHTVAKNENLGLMLEFDDAVDADLNAFLRTIHIVNLQPAPREIRLFIRQAFIIGDSGSNTDTAQFLPDDQAIVHYRGRRVFVISGKNRSGDNFDQYSVGVFGREGLEGTFRDAEDGELSGSAAEHGRVDSTIRFKLEIAGHGSQRVNYWIACGTTLREALHIHKEISNKNFHDRLDKTAKWWHNWLKPAQKVARRLDPEFRESFIKSAMILKSHVDKRGAIIASSDSEVLNYQRDAYAYCWPRDGAYAIWPLIRMGYTEEAYNFFDFCRRALSPKGYLAHKYRADGALGSSWHSYLHDDGTVSAPIQEDETALVLFLFCQYYNLNKDERLLKHFYEPMVVPMANFLANYIDKQTHLPKPSYDLWEENFMTTTYATAIVQAALYAAADLAEVKKDDENIVSWRTTADDIVAAAQKKLVNHKKKAFYKGLRRDKNGNYSPDETIDMSSVYGAFIFGLFAENKRNVTRALATALKRFDFSLDSPGLPRYENDAYYRRSPELTGNWWPITSLWVAQYLLERGDYDSAMSILKWVKNHADSAGLFPEQIDPLSDEDASVSPLCWSHAEFISTLLDTISK